jgi:hypothetical protein
VWARQIKREKVNSPAWQNHGMAMEAIKCEMTLASAPISPLQFCDIGRLSLAAMHWLSNCFVVKSNAFLYAQGINIPTRPCE